jgi:cation diffusion facilitator CzcD-associated flavoprotein CzcO
VVPDGDLFKAIRSGAASVVTDHIDRFTGSGIRLVSGVELEADVVVTATGLDLLFLGGIEVFVDGEKVDPAKRMVYKGMMIEDVPNLAFAIGYVNASWMLKADLTSGYVAMLLNEMRRTGKPMCRPHDASGTTVRAGSVFGLSSGYISRAADRLPKQGDREPWRVHHNYVVDYRAMKRPELHDGTMVFSDAAE